MSTLIGKRLHSLRIASGMSQEDVAGQLGCSRQKYSRMEKGTCDIGLETLSQCASLFHVSVAEITSVLDDDYAVAYRKTDSLQSAEQIKEMIGLFYANKRAYDKAHQKRWEGEEG